MLHAIACGAAREQQTEEGGVVLWRWRAATTVMRGPKSPRPVCEASEAALAQFGSGFHEAVTDGRGNNGYRAGRAKRALG